MVGAFTPPLIMARTGDAFRACFNAQVPGNVPTVYFEFRPDWDSENFLPESITWTKPVGADNLWTLNPAGYPVPDGGFVLGAVRGAVGGAGTSASLVGVTQTGREITMSVNMAQYFTVDTQITPPYLEFVTGSVAFFKSACSYGSGTERWATLFRVNLDGSETLVQRQMVVAGSPTITSIFYWKFVVTDSGVYYVKMEDPFARTVNSNRVLISVSQATAFVVKINGNPLLPGTNPTTTSGRYTAYNARTQDFTIETVPPSTSNIPGNPITLTLDATFLASRAQATQNAGDDHKFSITTPANTVPGAKGGVTIWMGATRYLVEFAVPNPFPCPAMTAYDVGTLPAGLTVTKTDASNWAVGISLAGGMKTLNMVALPAGAVLVTSSVVEAPDATIATIAVPNNTAYNITPKKLGTTKATVMCDNYNGDPAVILTLNITVTA